MYAGQILGDFYRGLKEKIDLRITVGGDVRLAKIPRESPRNERNPLKSDSEIAFEGRTRPIVR